MNHGITSVGQIEDYRRFDEVLDVRTPAEFADDHIPGSINCPVLDDSQRIEVGTCYKQSSPFAAKRIGAAYVAANIARHLHEQFADRPKSWRPLVVCWRGGQRSGAMTYVLRRIGWDAQQLKGGYKTYRKQVVETLDVLPRRLRFNVVCGATGSGKSRLLQALALRGEQVLDLEALACHKGSVLGVLPGSPQPSQKLFETGLLDALLPMEPGRPVYIEAESRKIGTIQIPNALLETMRAGLCINIEASLEARVDFLLGDYSYFLDSPDRIFSLLDELRKLHSRETIEHWQHLVKEAQWRTLVYELLERHYDPLYRRSQDRNFAGLVSPKAFTAADLTAPGIDTLVGQIIGS